MLLGEGVPAGKISDAVLERRDAVAREEGERIRLLVGATEILEQVLEACDSRVDEAAGTKGRIRCMRGFEAFDAAARFCRGYDELRNHLRIRSRHRQHVPANRRRLLHLRRATAVLAVLQAA